MRRLVWVLLLSLACSPVWAAGFATDSGCTLDDNLIWYFQMEEASGTRLDQTTSCGGGGCDLTDNNTVTQAVGLIGNAASFDDATSESLSRADEADLSLGADTDMCVAGWLRKSAETGVQTAVSKGSPGGTNGEYTLDYSLGADTFRFQVKGAVGTNTVATWSATTLNDTWYFVIGCHNSTDDVISIQVDNGTIVTAAHTDGTRDTTRDFVIGARMDGGAYETFWAGRLDEMAFWKNETLSTTERSDLYNGGAGSQYASGTTCVVASQGMLFIKDWMWMGEACQPTPTPGPGSIRRALAACRAKERS